MIFCGAFNLTILIVTKKMFHHINGMEGSTHRKMNYEMRVERARTHNNKKKEVIRNFPEKLMVDACTMTDVVSEKIIESSEFTEEIQLSPVRKKKIIAIGYTRKGKFKKFFGIKLKTKK